jgi:hypothetical protein
MDMNAILSRAATSIEPPKQLPPGQYLFRVLQVEHTDANGQPLVSSTGSPRFIFHVQAETPIDVDPSQLDGLTFPIKLRHNMYVTEASFFRFKTFLTDHLGQPAEGMDIKDLLLTAVGRMFRGSIIHQASSRPGDNSFYANISETFPAQ